MKFFEAISAFFGNIFGAGAQAEQERQQAGPKGAAYSDALQREAAAYYQAHQTTDGFDYDAFDDQFDAYYKAHGTANGFTYQQPAKT